MSSGKRVLEVATEPDLIPLGPQLVDRLHPYFSQMLKVLREIPVVLVKEDICAMHDESLKYVLQRIAERNHV